jgi:hypothetical protein
VREGKREFDRRHVPGFNPAAVKKAGAGKGNWGSNADAPKDEAAALLKDLPRDQAEAKAEVAAGEQAQEEVDAAPVDDGKITWAEFQKRRSATAQKADVRQVEAPKGMKVLHGDAGAEEKKAQQAGNNKKAAAPASKKDASGKTLSLQELHAELGGSGNASASPRYEGNEGQGFRGGRSGERGGARGGRGGRAVDIKSSKDFPSLGQ